MDLAQRLLTCFAAVFPTRSREELAFASRDAIDEWDSLASVTLLSLVNEEFRTDLDLFDLQDLGSFEALLGHVREAANLAGENVAHG
jgi:acyl carrier protein